MKKNNIKNFFPISSQTSDIDKLFLLKTIKLINSTIKNYKYLEIGSFLGGSLTPFIMDKKCTKILSIDERNKKLSDERSERWDYKKITEKTMINNLKKHNLIINKVQTFNGDIKNYFSKDKYNLIFIDGVHTDQNCFSDFLHGLDLIDKNSIIIFHDTGIIFKAIKLAMIYLHKNKIKFKFVKKSKSEMSAIFFGKFTKKNLKKNYGSIENFNNFFVKAKDNLLFQQINNRIKIKFKVSRFFKKKFPYKLDLIPEKTKISTQFHKKFKSAKN